MNLTSFEKGMIQGRKDVLLEQLEVKFGSLPPKVREKVHQMTWEQLGQFGKALLWAESLQELGLEP